MSEQAPYQPVRQTELPPVPGAHRAPEAVAPVIEGDTQIAQLEEMFAAPDAAEPQPVAEVAPVTPVDAEPAAAGGRHASNEVAAESNYEGHHRRQRFLVRQFKRLAGFAAAKAENWDSRRTTREFAGDQVERGRDAAARIGNAVVGSAKGAGEHMANNFREQWEADKQSIAQVKEHIITGGRAARARKDILVAAAKSRISKIGEGVKSGAEKAGRAAKVGGKVLAAAGIAPVVAAYAAGKYGGEKIVAGASVVGREVKRTAQDVRENAADIRTGSIEYSAQRAKAKSERAAAKHARKSAKAAARRAAAEATN